MILGDTTLEEEVSLGEIVTEGFELHYDFANATIQGHRDLPGVRKEYPCFDAKKEYAEI